MNGHDFDDDRGVPPVDYETAEADAIKEAMPMIEFWREAWRRFKVEINCCFDFEIDEIAQTHAARVDDHPDTVQDIYDAIYDYNIKDEQK